MKRKLKGFTLMELIIVIAIIGILSAILVPSMGAMIGNSKVKTQNGNAKVIFNAAQTAAQKRYFMERQLRTDQRIMGDGDFVIIWDGNTGVNTVNLRNAASVAVYSNSIDAFSGSYRLPHNPAGAYTGGFTAPAGGLTPIIAAADQEFLVRFIHDINKIFANYDKVVYKIYIRNYSVQSVVCAKNDTDGFVGSYPVRQEERTRRADRSIRNFDMLTID